ncbi:MAG: dihydropteroate synthase [Treponema sp.]|nr:dihydropteroate synthase [Treponema sp.]
MAELFLRDRKICSRFSSFVMGIVNCTPDSFYEKSRGGSELAFRLIDEGAEILDIGGESTRPGSAYIDEEEEIRRIVPVIEEIRKKSSVPISVDSRKKRVMEAAFNAGADILNDISALEDDKDMALFAKEKDIPVILMHKRGTPVNMQSNLSYTDIVKEVGTYLKERALFAQSCGIKKEKIILDPGIGFSKNREQNLLLIEKASLLADGEYPVLIGLSDKTFIGEITGKDALNRGAGTIAADIAACLYGAEILRVHDVSSCVDSLAVLESFKSLMEFRKTTG